MDNIAFLNEKFPHEKKILLANRISKMKGKEYKNDRDNVKKIIQKYNPDIVLTRNDYGWHYPSFEDLEDETYIQLMNYLDSKIINKEKQINYLTQNSANNNEESSSDIQENIKKNKLPKFTNSENQILNKFKYEKVMMDHLNDYTTPQTDEINLNVFMKKYNLNTNNKTISKKLNK